MTTIEEKRITFVFPAEWRASKFDEWTFYREHFVKQFNGIKGVDLLVHAPDGTSYLIEVKDYRHPETIKPSQLPQIIANKVLMTLAAMLPAKLNANVSDEKALAGAVLTSRKLRVVAHVELPRKRMPIVDPADLKQKLAKLLRAVDPHPAVVSCSANAGFAWTAS